MNTDRVKEFGFQQLSEFLGSIYSIHKYDDLMKGNTIYQVDKLRQFLCLYIR